MGSGFEILTERQTASHQQSCFQSARRTHPVYLGSRMLFTTTLTESAIKADSPAPGHFLFLQGLITQLANPKAIIFFTARWMDRLAGVFLISAGVKLALERRS